MYIVPKKCPRCLGFGEVSYFGEMVNCSCGIGVPDQEKIQALADRAWLIAEVERLTELAKTGGAKCTPEHTWAEWLADRNAALDAERDKVAKLRDALLHISNSHLGDCPAAFDELAHAKTHIGRLRKLALDALTASERAAKAAS